jgi:hypothetical protein
MVLLQSTVRFWDVSFRNLSPHPFDCCYFELLPCTDAQRFQRLSLIVEKVMDDCLVQFVLLGVSQVVRVEWEGQDASAI